MPNASKESHRVRVPSRIIVHANTLADMHHIDRAEPQRRLLGCGQPKPAADKRRQIAGRVGEPTVILQRAATTPATDRLTAIFSGHTQRAAGILGDHFTLRTGHHRPTQHKGVRAE
ncbi:MAG TPA: hypothetical protein DF699_09630, partial [Phycisphaerales bacterium]|nr:hypothetical protein [Phycisphaerales bacterium]